MTQAADVATKVGADDYVASGHSEADLDALPRQDLAPAIARHGDEFTLTWAMHDLVILLAQVREGHGGIEGEIAVTLAGAELHWARLNLASTSAREGLIKKLTVLERAVPWAQIVNHACRTTAVAMRDSAPAALLWPRMAAGPRHLFDPFLPFGELTVVFGDGGSGKGWFGQAVGLSVESGKPLPGGLHPLQQARVLYLDWESGADDLAERSYLLGHGLGCPAAAMHYRRMLRPLADEAASLRAEVSRLDIGLVIVDSLAPAAGAEPDGSDANIRTLNALRSLGPVTSLVLAHVRRTDTEHRGPARPYGSVFIWNLARSIWELRRSEEEPDDLVIGLYHRKVNRGRLHPPLSLRFAFTPDAVTIQSAGLAESSDLLASTSVAYRITAVLKAGARPVAELVEEVSATKDTVSRVLRRLASKGKVVRLPDTEPALWGVST